MRKLVTYLVMVITLILALIFIALLINNQGLSGWSLALAPLVAGFAGGIISPYEYKGATFAVGATIASILGTFAVILLFATDEIREDPNPASVAILIILLVLLILAVISIPVAAVTLSIGAGVGAVIGQLIFEQPPSRSHSNKRKKP